MQYLSPELSKRLTELTQENIAEIIQNKRYYVESKDHGIMVVCGHRIKWGEDSQELKVICPAWQVEDVLRSLKFIGEKLNWGLVCGICGAERPEKAERGDVSCNCDDPWYSWPQKRSQSVGERISDYLHDEGNTAYQKIEKYLWDILK